MTMSLYNKLSCTHAQYLYTIAVILMHRAYSIYNM